MSNNDHGFQSPRTLHNPIWRLSIRRLLTVLNKPESSLYPDKILVGGQSTTSNPRSKHNKILLGEAVIINCTKYPFQEPEDRD
jgi:hypothetical protein